MHPRRPFHRLALLLGALLGIVTTTQATVLTFDIFTNSTKSLTPPLGALNAAGLGDYGSNVSDFSPAAAYGPVPYYFNYGSAGGATPDVKVQYYEYNLQTKQYYGTDTVPTWFQNFYDVGIGDLTNVLYSSNGGGYPWALEIRFTPTNNQGVALKSFDLGSFSSGNIITNLMVLEDSTTTASNLWDAGMFAAPAAGTHTNFMPDVAVLSGHTLSLILMPGDVGANAGYNGLDNIVFTEQLIPEPSTVLLLAAGGLLLWRNRRRS